MLVRSSSRYTLFDYLETNIRDPVVVRPFFFSLPAFPIWIACTIILDMELGNYCSNRMSGWVVSMQRRIVPRH